MKDRKTEEVEYKMEIIMGRVDGKRPSKEEMAEMNALGQKIADYADELLGEASERRTGVIRNGEKRYLED